MIDPGLFTPAGSPALFECAILLRRGRLSKIPRFDKLRDVADVTCITSGYGTTWNLCGYLYQIRQLQKIARQAPPLLEALKQAVAASAINNNQGGSRKRPRKNDRLVEAMQLVAVIHESTNRGYPVIDESTGPGAGVVPWDTYATCKTNIATLKPLLRKKMESTLKEKRQAEAEAEAEIRTEIKTADESKVLLS